MFFQDFFHRTFRLGNWFKKVTQGNEYQNFLLKKKFFIHFILSSQPAKN